MKKVKGDNFHSCCCGTDSSRCTCCLKTTRSGVVYGLRCNNMQPATSSVADQRGRNLPESSAFSPPADQPVTSVVFTTMCQWGKWALLVAMLVAIPAVILGLLWRVVLEEYSQQPDPVATGTEKTVRWLVGLAIVYGLRIVMDRFL